METTNEKSRIIYLDLLRIFSCFAVIVLHTAAQNWSSQAPTSFAWQVFNGYDSASRFCVPVMVMISGVFFLNKNNDIPLKKLYGKYILRLLTAYIFWSFFYAIAPFIESGKVLNLVSIKGILKATINSYVHLWFLPMLIGIYMLVPFLHLIIKHCERKTLKYFLILFLIFGIAIPTIKLFKFPFSDYVDRIITRIPIDLVCGYAGYFVLGYYIFTYDISKKIRIASYIMGILSIPICILISYFYSVSSGKPSGFLYGYFTITTFFVSAAVFIFFKYTVSKIKWSGRSAAVIQSVSLCTFGIYLIHLFFLDLLKKNGFNTILFNPVLSVPIISLATFAASLILIFLLRKIPKINRYLM